MDGVRFLPTRDLCSLRQRKETGSIFIEPIAKSLAELVSFAGLGQEVDVILDVDEDEEEHEEGERLDSAGKSDSDSDSEDQTEDPIERRLAQNWLTRVVSLEASDVCAEDVDELHALQHQAAGVLAALCGNSASNLQTTRFVFQSNIRGAQDQDEDDAAATIATVRIQDSPVIADALGNRTWGAAPLLARRLLGDFKTQSPPEKVLELGAGTGLVGLAVAAALRQRQSNTLPCADLTDYHPHVLKTLQHNARLNGFEDTGGCKVARLDWQAVHACVGGGDGAAAAAEAVYRSTAQTVPDNDDDEADVGDALDGHVTSWPTISADAKYDLIIAADCIYDPLHPKWIRSVASQHLDRGSASSRMLLISPLRRTHQVEIDAIYKAFPRQGTFSAQHNTAPTLQITQEWEEVGHDNFGPQNFAFGSGSESHGQGGARRSKGLRSVYRCFEVRWTMQE